ncbi:MAG: A24 family peptidase C-terminal domain-containing protein [Candidatus Bathyarchaeota archaeon]
MNQILDGARIVLCLVFLVYASWSDYKSREVSNKVWLIFGPLALLLTGTQILFFASQPFQLVTFYVLSFAITSGLAITIFYVGGFGGADAKALMCIALALPVYPSNLLSHYVGFVSPLFPITIFSNSVLLGALSVFLDNSHMFPLEDIETTDDGEKSPKLLVFPNYDERENIIKRLKENKPNGWVWATPGLPLLIFITAGLIIALIIGDIIWLLLGSFLF